MFINKYLFIYLMTNIIKWEKDPFQSIWTGEYPVLVLSGALLSKNFLLDNNALNNARTGSHPVQMDWRGSQSNKMSC